MHFANQTIKDQIELAQQSFIAMFSFPKKLEPIVTPEDIAVLQAPWTDFMAHRNPMLLSQAIFTANVTVASSCSVRMARIMGIVKPME